MYGVPENLPVQRFVGDSLFQICIDVGGVYFVFGRAGTIAVDGRWEIVDSSGTIVDRKQEHKERESYRLHVILNAEVTDCRLDPPRSFSLTFATGHHLVIYDDSPNYESFHIYPDEIHV